MKEAVLYRELTLDRKSINTDSRVVPASLSSEIEVERYFGKEVLVHSDDAINFERAKDGLPLLFGHNMDQPIGRVEDVRIEDGRLKGNLRFSNNARATEVWNDVRDGFLRDISIGYRINTWEESDDSDVVRVTRWTPFEASVVSVPADHSVGVNRKYGDLTMSEKTENATANQPTDAGGVNVVAFSQARDQAFREGEAAAQAKYLKRTKEVNELFRPFLNRGPAFTSLRDECLLKGISVEQSRQALFDMFSTEEYPVTVDVRQADSSAWGEQEQLETRRPSRMGARVEAGKDQLDKYREGVEQALLIRVGTEKDRDIIAKARQNTYFSMGPLEMAREYLRINGITPSGDRSRVIGMALTFRSPIGHSTSDFANILENVANKSLQVGYNEAGETWSIWAKAGSLSDFRPGSRPNLSAFGDLDLIKENGEYNYGKFTDLKETLQLATYGKLFDISRQALINDDLDALGRIPAGMGKAAARTVGDLAYNVLINGTTVAMAQDATALFHANHGNLIASGSGGAPSVATVNVARTSMGTQTDPSGAATLNIRPRFLIVPLALEGTALTLEQGEYDPAGTAGTLTPNTVRNTFRTVADARLDAVSATQWYMAADPGAIDTVEVAFLDGQQSPYMEQQQAWSSDGVSYKVRIDAVAGPLDFRGLFKNHGS